MSDAPEGANEPNAQNGPLGLSAGRSLLTVLSSLGKVTGMRDRLKQG